MTQTRTARSFDEQVVAFAESQEGCVTTAGGMIPPPSSCSKSVHSLYGIAQWHLFTILIVVLFLGLMFELLMLSITRGGGGH